MTIEFDHLDASVADLAQAVREFKAAGYHLLKRDLGSVRRGNAAVALGGNSRIVLRGPGTMVASAVRVVSRTLGQDESGIQRAVFRVDDLDEYIERLRRAGIGVTRSGQLVIPSDPALPVLTKKRPKPGPPTTIAVTRLTFVSPTLDSTLDGLFALFDDPGSDGRWRVGLTTIAAERGEEPAVRARLNAARIPHLAVALGLSVPGDDVDHETAERLACALRIPTVSEENPKKQKSKPFEKLGRYLQKSFPLVHAELEWSTFGHSRLYRWEGKSPDVAALFLAHQDVVGVDDAQRWTTPPFSGVVDEEFVWGRGAIDDKSRVLAILEAAEELLRHGFQPEKTLYFAFGHDEEIGGAEGARTIAAHLEAEGVHADFVIDEGGIIGIGLVDGVAPPVASIMLGEKGHVTLHLSTTDRGGHSSMPPRMTAVGRIAAAVTHLQEDPFPLRMTPPVLDMVQRLAPHMPAPVRAVLTSAAALPRPVARILAMKPQTAALVRTTMAPTIIRGGVKENVLPQTAEAYVNLRILSGDTIDTVVERCVKIIDDELVRVTVAPGFAADPSPTTDPGSPHFDRIASIVRELVPSALITSGLVPGATDARHYAKVAEARFNFTPIVLHRTDLARIHGTDERISLANYKRIIDFNSRLMQSL